MTKHWTTKKVTSSIAENEAGEFVEVNIFTILLKEFKETKQFTIPMGEESRLTTEIETWLEFRRSIAD